MNPLEHDVCFHDNVEESTDKSVRGKMQECCQC